MAGLPAALDGVAGRIEPLWEASLMASRDVFALDRSGLNGFLFAAIGTEANGSRLTVLSALARLGEDPWAKAASWARMSKAAAGEALAATIAQMPVTREDQLAAGRTAARLVQMLAPSAAPAASPRAVQPGSSAPQSRPRLIVALALAACAAMLLSGSLLATRRDTLPHGLAAPGLVAGLAASPSGAAGVARP